MFYHRLGNIPHKRHVQFRTENNGSLYAEELVGTQGFSGVSSLVYHLHPPTMVKYRGEPYSVAPKIAVAKNLQALSFQGFDLPACDHYLESRTTLFVNHDLHVGLAAPRAGTRDLFFKNADADEILFVHRGSGILKTAFGHIVFAYGDYLDFKLPQELETNNERGDFEILIKKQGMIYPYIYATHPFDVVGWDGYLYPYGFSIFDFEPITGRIHQPPPVHQQFEGDGFVICSFVPRLYDYHPQAIPAPYQHSNIDSDEILYYVDGDFMSRNNIKKGQLTLHPAGLPHGPHPGTVERSIGKKSTEELAVMIDPFRPMMITEAALLLDVEDYYKSWMIEEI